jgi:hypothetical protein
MTAELRLTPEDRYCADTFNGAVAATAISATWEIGLLDDLDRMGTITLSDFADRNGCHPPLLHVLALALSGRQVVEYDGTVFPDQALPKCSVARDSSTGSRTDPVRSSVSCPV